MKKRPAAAKTQAVVKRPRPSGVFVKNNPNGNSESREASSAEFQDQGPPFAQGAFRNVYRGRYISGPRAGQECVMKEFKKGCVHEKKYFDADITAVKKAGELIEQFNELGVVSKMVYLNEPEVWTGTQGRINGHNMLVEPMIKGEYFKFNSNTGYASSDSDTMQALSHFTYHVSNGKYLLCDLQGGRYNGYYVLTDPVILSVGKEFGGTDIGEDGINNFMAHHRCGRFCSPNWKMPPVQKLIPKFEAVSGTTFGVGTLKSLFSKEKHKQLEVIVKKQVQIKVRDLWQKELNKKDFEIVTD